MSSNPSQNCGMEIPEIAKTRAKVSVQDPGRAAETTPSGTEIAMARVRGGARQRQRVGESVAELVEDQLVGPQRPAKVQAEHAADPAGELDHQRVVQPEPLPDGLQLFRGRGHVSRVGPPVDLRRIAGHELEDHEGDEEDHEENGNEEQEPVDDLANHSRSAEPARHVERAPGGVPGTRRARYFRSTLFQTCGQKNSGWGWYPVTFGEAPTTM